MKLSDFDYSLPEELIAQHPVKPRDRSRLMVVNRSAQTITHDVFHHLPEYLPPSSLVVANDSKVVAARLFAVKERSGGRVEVFLLQKRKEAGTYDVLMRPMKRIQNGDRLLFDDGKFSAIVINKEQRIIRFEQGGVSKLIDRVGHMPLPPYIRRQDNATDRRTYQTVYAKRAGSVAAPTAGLHFTKPLMTRMKKEGFLFDHVTLHINYGTFAPVECEDVTAHPIHWERYSVRLSTWKRVKAQRKRNRPVIAIGTTSVRVLEHAARSKFLSGQTNLFIYPSFRFRMVDHFVTNFHLPKSTLFMLVCAFGGTELIRRAYREAVREKYRFYSYGDAMLII